MARSAVEGLDHHRVDGHVGFATFSVRVVPIRFLIVAFERPVEYRHRLFEGLEDRVVARTADEEEVVDRILGLAGILEPVLRPQGFEGCQFGQGGEEVVLAVEGVFRISAVQIQL